jgi:hypothetical protein
MTAGMSIRPDFSVTLTVVATGVYSWRFLLLLLVLLLLRAAGQQQQCQHPARDAGCLARPPTTPTTGVSFACRHGGSLPVRHPDENL